MNFELRRENLDALIEKYNGYVALYKFVNNGSIEGITGFEEFYRNLTYFSKYEDDRIFMSSAV